MKRVLTFLGGAGFLVLSVNLLFYGLTEPEVNRLWRAKSLPATGTVVTLKSVREGTVTARYPVIEYVTSSGRRLTFTSKLRATDFEAYAPGQKVPIRYSRIDPENAAVDSAFHNWGPMTLFICAGIASLAASLYLIVAGVRSLLRTHR